MSVTTKLHHEWMVPLDSKLRDFKLKDLSLLSKTPYKLAQHIYFQLVLAEGLLYVHLGKMT